MILIRFCLFILLVWLYACGGGYKEEQQSGIVFNLSQASEGAPYSKLILRISGKEFDPMVYVKDGPLYPGQKVVFEVNVPEGKERLIEAILYDGDGNPVYYAYTVTDLSKDSYVVLNLTPTKGMVEVLETFSDRPMAVEGQEVFVLSEDLFSVNWKLVSYRDGYLPGAYVAALTNRGAFYAPVGERLFLQKDYTINVENPITDLELFGSYEGALGESLKTQSSKITSNKEVALVGFGKGVIYYAVGKELNQPFHLNGPTCVSRSEPDCKRINLQVGGFGLEPTKVVANYRGIEFPVGEPSAFLFLDTVEYYLQLERSIESESCMAYFRRLENIQKPLPEEKQVSVVPRSFILDAPFQRLRAYSSLSLSLYECDVERREFFAFPSEGDSLFVEVFLDGQWVGVRLDKPWEVREVKLPSLRIKEISLSLKDSYLLFEFSTTERPSYCNLELFSGEYTTVIYKIPPYRSYLRVRKIADKFFDTIPNYRLTCFKEDGGYARREGPLELH